MPQNTSPRKTGMAWLIGTALTALAAVGVFSVVSATDSTLKDGETIHNAFFDRRFRKDKP